MIDVRKLAAIDILLLGPKLILTEFAVGVLGPIALGIFTLLRNRSNGQIACGAYLVALGINYVPLLLHAISLSRRGSSQQELGDEVADKPQAIRKYRRQSLMLLLPLVVPVAAIAQEWRRKKGN